MTAIKSASISIDSTSTQSVAALQRDLDDRAEIAHLDAAVCSDSAHDNISTIQGDEQHRSIDRIWIYLACYLLHENRKQIITLRTTDFGSNITNPGANPPYLESGNTRRVR